MLNFSSFPCFLKKREQNRVCAFAENPNNTFGITNDNSHPLSCWVEFDEVEKLPLLAFWAVVNENVVFLITVNVLDSEESRCVDKSQLIRGARVVVKLSILVLDNDGMANCKVKKNLFYVIIVLWVLITPVSIEMLIMEVHIWNFISFPW